MAEISAREKADLIIKTLDKHKGMDIELLQVGGLTTLGEYFIICTATSTPHIKSLADEVEFELKENLGELPRIEGYNTGTWILMDCGNIIVHLFIKDSREFYKLERLWADAPKPDISDVIS